VLGILCYTARKTRDFLCNGWVVVDAKLVPPKIFAGAHARPGTGRDSGLAFMMPRTQTVNLACNYKDTSRPVQVNIDRGFKSYFVSFFEFFRKGVEFVDKAQFEVHL